MTVCPMVNRDSQFFWDGTKVGELRIQKCNACGAKRFPPGPACQSCEAYDRGYDVAAAMARRPHGCFLYLPAQLRAACPIYFFLSYYSPSYSFTIK